MKRYRVRLGYPRQAGSRLVTTELVYANDAHVVDGVLRLTAAGGRAVAIYKSGHWTSVREVAAR
jgi:hypothetical protein